jgi:hypothetical protein
MSDTLMKDQAFAQLLIAVKRQEAQHYKTKDISLIAYTSTQMIFTDGC